MIIIAIVGGVVGDLVVIAILFFLLLWLRKRGGKENDPQNGLSLLGRLIIWLLIVDLVFGFNEPSFTDGTRLRSTSDGSAHFSPLR
jgi:hypothetical protein